MIDQNSRGRSLRSGADRISLFDERGRGRPTAYTGGRGSSSGRWWGTADGIGILGDATIAAVHAPPVPG